MGYTLRAVERTGRSLLSYFPQTGVKKREQCGRDECVPCTQGGEDLPNCTKQSVVYESICIKCNPGAMKKGELENVCEGAPSLYVGETSRSIQQRAVEHWGAARRGDKDSHMTRPSNWFARRSSQCSFLRWLAPTGLPRAAKLGKQSESGGGGE